MPAHRSRGARPQLLYGAVLVAAAITSACIHDPFVPNLSTPGGFQIYQGEALPFPVTSDRGTMVTIAPLAGVGLTVAPLSYEHIFGTEGATITAASNATTGTHHFQVTGVNGSGTRTKTQTISVTVLVLNPFDLRPVSAVSGRAGQLITGAVRLDIESHFERPITLAMQGMPQGSTVQFAPIDSAKSVFTILTPTGTVPGPYQATITGTSGGAVRTVALTIDILPPLVSPDFSMVIKPTSVTILPNGTAIADVLIARNSAATGIIALSVSGQPSTITPRFSPAPLSGDSTRLTLTSSNAVPGNPFTVTITGVANGVTRSVNLTVTIVPVPALSLTTSAQTITLQNLLTTLQSVVVNIARTGLVGPVTLVANGVPSGINTAFNASPATGATSDLVFSPLGTTTPGDYPVSIVGTAGNLSASTQVVLKVLPSLGDFTPVFQLPSYTAAQGSTNVLFVDLNRTGALVGVPITLSTPGGSSQFSAVVAPNPTTATVAQINLTVGATAAIGAHVLRITATGGALTRTDSTIITVTTPPPPGFRLSATPDQFQLPRDAFTPFAILVSRISGFAGTVTLSAVNPLPGQFIFDFTPLPSAPDVIRVSIYASSNVTPGTYNIPFVGTSGALTFTLTVPVIVTP